jgi:hypothetical protein
LVEKPSPLFSSIPSHIQPTWTAENWLKSLNILEILSKELLNAPLTEREKALFGEHQGSEAERIKGLRDAEVDAAVDAAAEHWKRELRQQVKELSVSQSIDAGVLNEKFAADPQSIVFEYGTMKDYHNGLEGLIGNPDPRVEWTMQEEHCTSTYANAQFKCWYLSHPPLTLERGGLTTAQEQYSYVVTGSAAEVYVGGMGMREQGNQGCAIQQFVEREEAQKAGLTKVEVIALRLYTGPMFLWYNKLLRGRKKFGEEAYEAPYDNYKKEWREERRAEWEEEHAGERMDEATRLSFDRYKAEGYPHFPFRTTLHVLNSAITKLSRTQTAERVYRGTRGGVLPPQFWNPNAYNVKGGIELGFMSTTKDRTMAMKYATAQTAAEGDARPQLVFEMQMGMVDRGAPLQWCSQFPAEEEVLFAPLTGLEVCGAPRVEKGVIIVELRMSTNLHDLTIEEVLSKMQKTHLGLVNIIKADLRREGFPAKAWSDLNAHENNCSELREPIWFNTAANFLTATKEALQCKLRAYEYVLGGTDKEAKKVAVRMLSNPNDALALESGISVLVRRDLQVLYTPCTIHYAPYTMHHNTIHSLYADLQDGKLDEFEKELEKLCDLDEGQKALATLSLTFQGQKLTSGPSGPPDVLLRLCAKARVYDLTGNSFQLPTHSYLHELVSRAQNLSRVRTLDLHDMGEKYSDLNGVQYYEQLHSLNLLNTALTTEELTIIVRRCKHLLFVGDELENEGGGRGGGREGGGRDGGRSEGREVSTEGRSAGGYEKKTGLQVAKWLVDNRVLQAYVEQRPLLVKIDLEGCNGVKGGDVNEAVHHLGVTDLSCFGCTPPRRLVLPKLQTIVLSMCDSLAGVAHLSSCPSLTKIDLNFCAELEDIKALAPHRLPNLTALDLSSCAGIKSIEPLTHGTSKLLELTIRRLRHCTDRWLQHVPRTVAYLSLSGCQRLSEASAQYIRALPQLKVLVAPETATDQWLDAVCHEESCLEEIDLDDCTLITVLAPINRCLRLHTVRNVRDLGGISEAQITGISGRRRAVTRRVT